MSVKQENRYRRSVIESGRLLEDRTREMEALHWPRGKRPARRDVEVQTASRLEARRWMRAVAEDYDTATELAEAAGAAFRLPGRGLDDETHWVWDEALVAVYGS
ncbi:hypothetical protein [Acidithiobacillus caldus]|jgi:hypothetical protein|uniref:hypothetical protein n=1 Tax=Acidithiobacillus caldus TaxID=33059 RepID=UPI001C06F0F1|nr:hypothetical protein [Acidithiobacillus caldus]MBU2762467.1 hypothetical protein [Acidithiobacillus caldus]MBU2771507.1 hypothetical protein [Acidithiobacillus caldus]MBU2783866.1 hypothetical protein [Acidithiobacillus caldus]